ncbi:MAG: DegV family protein [Clostridia bacterium]|nr:DegV family protein [Clostridia bacterium]
MRKYIIMSDTCSDLSKKVREQYDLEYVPMRYIYDDNDVEASLDWEPLSAKEFYDVMRKGTRIRTAAVNTQTFLEHFEKYLKEGYDVLYIACSKALSTSINSANAAKDELLPKYPEAKIICVDSINSTGCLTLLCIKASKLRAEGKTIEETAAWVEENKKFFNQEAVVDKLAYLKQAGRVSASSAFFGDLLSIKPVIISDIHGYNYAVEKVKGRKRSIARIIEKTIAEYVPNDLGIAIHHADCLDEALAVKETLKEALGLTDDQFEVDYIGPTVGASVGPGTLSIFFYGTEVTADSLADSKK